MSEQPESKPRGLLSAAEPIFTVLMVGSFLAHAAGVFAVVQFESPPDAPAVRDLSQYRAARPAFLPIPTRAQLNLSEAEAEVELPVPTARAKRAARAPEGAGAGRRAALASVIGQLEGSASAQVFRTGSALGQDVGEALRVMDGRGITTQRLQRKDGPGPQSAKTDKRQLYASASAAKPRAKTRAQLPVVDVKTPPVTSAQFDKRALSAALKRRAPEVQRCYESVIKRDSDRAGKIVVELDLATSGRALSVDYLVDTVGSGELRACVTGVLKRTRFPRPPAEVTVEGRFVFAARSKS